MEFTIKSGSPEKQRSACVVVGVFDNRKLSLSAELIDRASNGYVSEIIRRGDMEGKLGATLLLHNVRGTLADRVLLVGLGKERDFRDREFRSAVEIRGEAPKRDRLLRSRHLSDRGKGEAARGRLARRACGRRRNGSRLPLRPHEKREGRGPPTSAQAHAVGTPALGPHGRRSRRGARSCDRARHGFRPRPRQPSGQRLHAELPRPAGPGAREGIPGRQGDRPRAGRHRGAQDGLVPVGDRRQRRAAALHRDGVSRQSEKAEADGAGRQGHHVRHRRDLVEARTRHGSDEVRHVRRRFGIRDAPRGRGTQGRRSTWSGSSPRARTCRRDARPSRATW